METDSKVELNELGQSIGERLKNWAPPPSIRESSYASRLSGNYAELRPLESTHATDLYKAFSQAGESLWTYLPYGPCKTAKELRDIISLLNSNGRQDCYTYAIFDKQTSQQHPLGFAAYLRILPNAGSIEIGHLAFSPLMQGTQIATEAIFLMIDLCFRLGYRRCEWKCNDLNEPSIKAAKRFGFTYEGTFRNALVVKERNRDTAWFSIIDREWPELRKSYLRWLDESNFDSEGCQALRLSDLTRT